MTTHSVSELVADLEEEWAFDGVLPLYQLTWHQGIGSRPDEQTVILEIAQEVYDELLRRHPHAWLGWIVWPHLSPDAVERAEPGTSLDFLLDHTDTTRSARLQVLVDARTVESSISALITSCTAGQVSLVEFEERFLALHSAMPEGTPADVNQAVDDLFWAVESYVAEPSLRSAGDTGDTGDTGDDELRAAIKAASERLGTRR